MSFNAAKLNALAHANGLTIWHYDAADEAALAEAAHFDDARGLVRPGDLVFWSRPVEGGRRSGLLLISDVTADRVVHESVAGADVTAAGALQRVLLGALEAGQVLTYDGQAWINGDPAGVAGDAHSQATGNPHQTAAADIGAIAVADKGRAGGVASLDADGRVPAAQLRALALAQLSDIAAASPQPGHVLAFDGQVWTSVAPAGRLGDAHSQATGNPHQTTAADIGAVLAADKGRAGGVASLDAGGRVPAAQLPPPPAADVGSVFGRKGTIAAQAGDYTADQIADTAQRVLMTPAERAKLAGVQAGAQANPPPMANAQVTLGSDTAPMTPSPAQLKLAAQTWGGSTVRAITVPAADDAAISLELPAAVNRRNFLLAFTASGAVTTTKAAQAGDVDRLVTEAPAALAGLPQLKAAAPNPSRAVVLLGRAAPGDGGGGVFYWDPASTEAENGGTIFAPASGGSGRWKRVIDGNAINVKWFGAKGDGTTDDTAAIQAAIDFGVLKVGLPAVSVNLGIGTYRISAPLICTRRALVLSGAGIGNPTTFSSGPGFGTTLVWHGPAAQPMMQVFDCAYLVIQDILFLGNASSKPSAAIDFVGGGSIGTNEYISVRRCKIGTLPWSPVAPGTRSMVSGIVFSGPNANNDQFRIEDCTITDCDIGLHLPNTQSIWGVCFNVHFAQCGKGVRSAATTKFVNAQFWNCGVDIETLSSARVLVDGWWSENSHLIFNVTEVSSLSVRGGKWTIQSEMQGSTAIARALTLSENLSIIDVHIDYQITPKPPLVIRGQWSRPYVVRIQNCVGLDSLSLLDIQGYAAPNVTYVDIDTQGIRLSRTITNSGLGTAPFLSAGRLGVSNAVAATSPGSMVRKIEVFDDQGRSIGFLPVYSSIA